MRENVEKDPKKMDFPSGAHDSEYGFSKPEVPEQMPSFF